MGLVATLRRLADSLSVPRPEPAPVQQETALWGLVATVTRTSSSPQETSQLLLPGCPAPGSGGGGTWAPHRQGQRPPHQSRLLPQHMVGSPRASMGVTRQLLQPRTLGKAAPSLNDYALQAALCLQGSLPMEGIAPPLGDIPLILAACLTGTKWWRDHETEQWVC